MLKKACFPVYPAFLPGVFNFISPFRFAQKKGGKGVMLLPVFHYGCPVFIGIAVAAEMGAAAVGAYVMAQKAGASFSDMPVFIGGNFEGCAQEVFHVFLGEAPCGIHSQGFE